MGEDRRHVWVSRNNVKYFSALQLTEAFKGFLHMGWVTVLTMRDSGCDLSIL